MIGTVYFQLIRAWFYYSKVNFLLKFRDCVTIVFVASRAAKWNLIISRVTDTLFALLLVCTSRFDAWIGFVIIIPLHCLYRFNLLHRTFTPRAIKNSQPSCTEVSAGCLEFNRLNNEMGCRRRHYYIVISTGAAIVLPGHSRGNTSALPNLLSWIVSEMHWKRQMELDRSP